MGFDHYKTLVVTIHQQYPNFVNYASFVNWITIKRLPAFNFKEGKDLENAGGQVRTLLRNYHFAGKRKVYWKPGSSGTRKLEKYHIQVIGTMHVIKYF